MSATEPRVLLIALGNSLRRDDGVAQQVLALLPPRPGVASQALLQITPELAADLAGVDLVVFIDADVQAAEVQVEEVQVEEVRVEEVRVEEPGTEPVGQSFGSALTHGGDPVSLVALAAQLFGFNGRALLCRIPAEDFAPGDSLSPKASAAALVAARQLEMVLSRQTSRASGSG